MCDRSHRTDETVLMERTKQNENLIEDDIETENVWNLEPENRWKSFNKKKNLTKAIEAQGVTSVHKLLMVVILGWITFLMLALP